jgi:O-antigen/teichoic acid export membrane protein
VAFSAGNLWLLPFLALLEGCNQMTSTSRFRLIQALVSNLATWVVLALGGELWALPVLSGTSLLLLLSYLAFTQRSFFEPFFRPPRGAKLHWQRDLFPMQWRLAIQGLFSYLSFPIYPVLIFTAVGAVEAGRVGMGLQIVNAIQSLGLVLLSTRAPKLAIAIAQGRQDLLQKLWWTASLQAIVMMTFLSTAFVTVLTFATFIDWPPADRVISVFSFTLLILGSLMALAVQCVAVYLRAHRVERLTLVGVVSGAAYGLSAWAVAPTFGSLGIASSYLMVTAFVTLPLTLRVYSRARSEETEALRNPHNFLSLLEGKCLTVANSVWPF